MTDYRTTGLHVVFERVRELAARQGVAIASSEIIGLVPSEALVGAAARALALRGFEPSHVLERRIEEVAAGGAAGARG